MLKEQLPEALNLCHGLVVIFILGDNKEPEAGTEATTSQLWFWDGWQGPFPAPLLAWLAASVLADKALPDPGIGLVTT